MLLFSTLIPQLKAILSELELLQDDLTLAQELELQELISRTYKQVKKAHQDFGSNIPDERMPSFWM